MSAAPASPALLGPPAPTVLQAVWEASQRWPARRAHLGPDGAIAYAELWDRAQAVAAWHEAQPPPGPVLVYGHKEPAMLVAFLGAALAGRPYVPTDTVLPLGRVRRIAVLSGSTAWLAPRSPRETPVGGAEPGLVLGAAGELVPPRPRRPQDPAPDPLAYILFTSGSTGDPKGVPIPWSAVAHFVGWMRSQQRLEPGREVVLNQAPFSFDLSVMDLYLALTTGGTLVSIPRGMVQDPRTLFPALAAADLTVWVSTPSFAQFCLAEPTFGAGMLPRLRRMLFCGETLPAATARALLQRFPEAEVWNTYGPTETTVAVTSVRITPELAAGPDPLPVGAPAPGMRVWVAGPDLAELAPGEAGEVVIAGPQVSPGYLAGPAAGRGFVSLPPARGGGTAYRTGDAGYARDGQLFCVGRLDRQVKLHGYRLELDEIEAHLTRLDGVCAAAVLPVVREGRVQHLVAFVVAEPAPDPAGAFAAAQQLRHELGGSLPPYAIPRLIRFLPALPLTPNGKVDRRHLEALAEQRDAPPKG